METKTEQYQVATRVTGTQIEQWGEREIIKELVSRMMAFHPAASEVGEKGMLAAAQLAVMVGASPLPGLNEIHIWKDRGGKVHVDPGVNYYRRRSREVGGGIRWMGASGKPRPMTLEEKAMYGIPENQHAAICTGMRGDDFDKYWALGVRFPEIENVSSVTGIAIAGQGESKNGRPPIWTAIKRAEVDLLRQLYPNLERPEDPAEMAREAIRRLGGDSGNDPDWDPNVVFFGDRDESASEIINGEVSDAPPATQVAEQTKVAEPKEEPGDRPHQIKIDLFAKASQYSERYANGPNAGKATEVATQKQAQLIASMFTEAFAPADDARKRYKSALAWLFEVDSATKLTFCQARAVLDWMLAGRDDTGAYQLAQGVEDDAQLILRQAMIDAGQMDMFNGDEEV